MLDPKRLRSECSDIAEQLSRRGFQLDTDKCADLEQKRQVLQATTQELQAKRNHNSKAIGQAKAQGKDVASIMAEMEGINDTLKSHETELEKLQQQLLAFQYTIPNVLHESVPSGKSEADNIEIRQWGQPRQFDFEVKDHVALGEDSGLLDMERAAKLSGARFVVLQGRLAKLQRALAQLMLDTHTRQHDYKEVYVPYLVHSESLYGTGQLPKFAEDHFSVTGDSDLHLIPTAEVPLANLHRSEIIEDSALPIKYVTQTPCFRSEAGSYGKDTRGMFRVHQFEKVEMVQLVRPDDSYEALEQITSHAEKILQLLELPYRVVLLCGGDTGFSAAKTYDIEVWLPGQQAYREISSCSNCTDFQSRRMQLRYRDPQSKKPGLLHTLNGSGLAVGRTLVALMENHQDKEGRIHVPKVLQPYMHGIDWV